MTSTIRNEIEAEHTAHEAYRERMIGYLATVRNSSLDHETRLVALMKYDSACWKRRKRHALIGEDTTPCLSPRLAMTIQKHDAPKVERLRIVPPDSLKGFSMELLQRVDADGVGLDYAEVRAKLLAKFPTVQTKGPHHGKPTKMSIKDIVQLAADLNKGGMILPSRPRRVRALKHNRGVMAVTEASDTIHTCRCIVCDGGFTPAERIRRPPLYCSGSCRQAAHRNRAAAVNHASVTL